jgi:hypothetical protein
MTKYCINCKHYFTPEEMIYGVSKTYTAPRAPKYALCRAVEAPKSLVTGEPIGDAYVMCSAARIHPCGEDAKFYQFKED